MKVTKSTMVRSLLRAGKTAKEISKTLKVSPQFVYTQKWMMKGGNKKVKVNAAKKKAQLHQPKILLTAKPTPLTDFVREELANIERQIDNLNTIASFLAIRLRQMEQNGE